MGRAQVEAGDVSVTFRTQAMVHTLEHINTAILHFVTYKPYILKFNVLRGGMQLELRVRGRPGSLLGAPAPAQEPCPEQPCCPH